MTPQEFGPYLERQVRAYADDHVRDGRWARNEALEKAREEVARLLPQGLATPGHHLLSIVDGSTGVPVGAIWLGMGPHGSAKKGWIYDLIVEPQYRRKGYGGEAMIEVEHFARREGVESLGLHVFGHNHAAIALYQKLGYAPTGIQMEKRLGSG